jgi:hypothetical protein
MEKRQKLMRWWLRRTCAMAISLCMNNSTKDVKVASLGATKKYKI